MTDATPTADRWGLLRWCRGWLLLSLLCAGCASAPPSPPQGLLAVWDLDDLTGTGAHAGLGEILAGKAIERVQAEGYAVVERQRLVALLEELRLGSGALADESTRLRLGRLSGARLMLFGGYQAYGDSLRMDLRLVEVETARVVAATQRTVPARDLAAALQAVGEGSAELMGRH
ncbi:MAG TPA: FlgO family outer membrane protein [Deferrisomatales bacterium]|nr:FlgO family outer membrane protein [Deferrisomatales bacterium]